LTEPTATVWALSPDGNTGIEQVTCGIVSAPPSMMRAPVTGKTSARTHPTPAITHATTAARPIALQEFRATCRPSD